MATNGGSGFMDTWPTWAKLVLALAGAAMWIGMPMVAALSLAARTVQAGGVVDYQPILVVLVGMTTATITGIFVFMTFRIDRGTKLKAEQVAKGEAARVAKEEAGKAIEGMKETAACDLNKMKQTTACDLKNMKTATKKNLKDVIDMAKPCLDSLNKAKDKANEALDDALKKIAAQTAPRIDEEIQAIRAKIDEMVTPTSVREEITARITDEVLRSHIKAVLMVEANGRIVAEYARQHAEDLNPG